MNTNKTAKIRNITYKLSQNSQTNWVFLWVKGRSYSVAQIVDGDIITIDREEVTRGVTNRELAETWLSN